MQPRRLIYPHMYMNMNSMWEGVRQCQSEDNLMQI